eukprot:scaffold64959_cov41-Phaeocystis_antarctica.AAC.5
MSRNTTPIRGKYTALKQRAGAGRSRVPWGCPSRTWHLGAEHGAELRRVSGGDVDARGGAQGLGSVSSSQFRQNTREGEIAIPPYYAVTLCRRSLVTTACAAPLLTYG